MRVVGLTTVGWRSARFLAMWASPVSLFASSKPANESQSVRVKSLPYEALVWKGYPISFAGPAHIGEEESTHEHEDGDPWGISEHLPSIRMEIKMPFYNKW